jgi:membrane protein YdbS with pleckstrin-like domain
MASSDLTQGEQVIFKTRTHLKVLTWPIAVLVIAAAAVIASNMIEFGGSARSAILIAIAALATLAVLAYTVPRWVSWLASSDTLTTRRLISRQGVVKRLGSEIPLSRVQGVESEQSLLDRLFGCGTLVVQTAGETSNVVLVDIPRVSRHKLQIQQLLDASDAPLREDL